MRSFALGLARLAITDPTDPTAVSSDTPVLDTFYPIVYADEADDLQDLLAKTCGHPGGSGSYRLEAATLRQLAEKIPAAHADQAVVARALADSSERSVTLADGPRVAVACFIEDTAAAPVDIHDVYLRLHLLSYRRVQPHGANLDGAFGLLTNVVWTDHGPFAVDTFAAVRGQLALAGTPPTVKSIDKFPRMLDYVVPTGVRIADGSRVRLGAHLASGTTVMHEGFVNFNAGTLGSSMVEGRISAGVVVDDGSDVGGGASIMGTLSGGGKEVIRLGKRCLLGANSGCGISLGDGCTIEAGLYLTAGSKIRCQWDGEVRKARDLSGTNGLLFRRNSQDGAIEALQLQADKSIALNAALHAND